MARSYRKYPGCGWTVCESDKKYKVVQHRKQRRHVKQLLHCGYEDHELPHVREYGNVYQSNKDGKQYFGHLGSARLVWGYLILYGKLEEEIINEQLALYIRLMRK